MVGREFDAHRTEEVVVRVIAGKSKHKVVFQANSVIESIDDNVIGTDLLDRAVEIGLDFSVANTILDIRFHTMNMTEQEALDLMINDTFQEKAEATAKIQRAQLSSCQLPTYFVGWRGWLDVRDEYKKRKGAGFNLTEFHDAALKESAVPLPVLGQLLH